MRLRHQSELCQSLIFAFLSSHRFVSLLWYHPRSLFVTKKKLPSFALERTSKDISQWRGAWARIQNETWGYPWAWLRVDSNQTTDTTEQVHHTVRNEVAKVMFLHLSVSHSVYRGGVPGQAPPGPGTPPRTRYPPWDQVHPPPWDQVHPGPGTPPGTRYTPPGTRCPPRQVPPRQVHPLGPGTPRQVHPLPTPAHGYCCGRYASYWNAFLLLDIFAIIQADSCLFKYITFPIYFYSLFKESSFWHQNDRIGGQSIICVDFTSSKTRKPSRKLDERRSKYVLSSCFTRA